MAYRSHEALLIFLAVEVLSSLVALASVPTTRPQHEGFNIVKQTQIQTTRSSNVKCITKHGHYHVLTNVKWHARVAPRCALWEIREGIGLIRKKSSTLTSFLRGTNGFGGKNSSRLTSSLRGIFCLLGRLRWPDDLLPVFLDRYERLARRVALLKQCRNGINNERIQNSGRQRR